MQIWAQIQLIWRLLVPCSVETDSAIDPKNSSQSSLGYLCLTKFGTAQDRHSKFRGFYGLGNPAPFWRANAEEAEEGIKESKFEDEKNSVRTQGYRAVSSHLLRFLSATPPTIFLVTTGIKYFPQQLHSQGNIISEIWVCSLKKKWKRNSRFFKKRVILIFGSIQNMSDPSSRVSSP